MNREHNKLEEITIKLEGNATTGYSWDYEVTNKDIITEIARDYVDDSQDEYGAMGSGGVFTFTFVGVTPGTTEMLFKYTRPWENDESPEMVKLYDVTVDANKIISVKKT